MAATIIQSLQEFIASFTGLTEGAPVWVAIVGPEVAQYAVTPLPGQRVVEEYLDGGRLMEFPFAINSVESTADDLSRLAAAGFMEALAEWFDAQTEAGDLPTLPTGKVPESIQAVTWGYLYQETDSQTGIYQVQCKLTYTEA